MESSVLKCPKCSKITGHPGFKSSIPYFKCYSCKYAWHICERVKKIVEYDGVRAKCKYCNEFINQYSVKSASEYAKKNIETLKICASELQNHDYRVLRNNLCHIFNHFFVYYFKSHDETVYCNYCFKNCVKNKLDFDIISIDPHEYDKIECSCTKCKTIISKRNTDYNAQYWTNIIGKRLPSISINKPKIKTSIEKDNRKKETDELIERAEKRLQEMKENQYL